MRNYITVVPWNSVNDEAISPNISTDVTEGAILHPLIEGKANTPGTRYQASFYDKFAVDIVTETVYNYRYPYITEKTLRPIACKRLFIVVGAPGVLKVLHSKGFKTFSDVIDESYDSEIDSVKRWYLLESAIKSFVSKPLDEIKDIVRSKSDILDHNFVTLQHLEKVELECLK